MITDDDNPEDPEQLEVAIAITDGAGNNTMGQLDKATVTINSEDVEVLSRFRVFSPYL